MESDARPLILIDIDGVLAMYRGADCRIGAPIYRTGKDIPEALHAVEALQIRAAVLTHRTRYEARCILGALGLQTWSERLISANDLFWQSLREVFWKGRLRGLSKAVAADILTGRFGPYNAECSVLIDDKLSNLIRMTEAGVVRFGILTPGIHCDASGKVHSFDLRLILTMAVALAQGKPVSCDTAGPCIFRFPAGSETLAESELHTGQMLSGSRLDVVSLLRTLKRVLAGANPHS